VTSRITKIYAVRRKDSTKQRNGPVPGYRQLNWLGELFNGNSRIERETLNRIKRKRDHQSSHLAKTARSDPCGRRLTAAIAGPSPWGIDPATRDTLGITRGRSSRGAMTGMEMRVRQTTPPPPKEENNQVTLKPLVPWGYR